jgi:outer membrane protein assembly factor BamB
MRPSNRLLIRLALLSAALLFTWSDRSNSQRETARSSGVDVLTQHNDNDRTGHNPNETILTPDKVNREGFGKLFDLEVDGLIYAQPLVVSGIQLAGKMRNLALAPTMHNSLYCFDADTGERLWRRNFGPPVPTPNASWNKPDGFYRDLTPEVGIASTPVIDRATGTIYFSHMTWDTKTNPPAGRHWLRAIDLVTQQDRFGSPVRVEGSVNLRGQDAIAVMPRHIPNPPTLSFDPNQHLQRPALLLSQGRVLLGYGGHFDKTPFQGWVFSYAARQLQDAPLIWGSTAGGPATIAPGGEGGIWQAGMGLTADEQGNIYLMTGNGKFSQELAQFGDSVVKLSSAGGALQAADYFTPCNQSQLSGNDADLGASGVLHLPGTNLIVGGGKQARLYLLDTRNLGKFAGDSWDFNCANPNVRQEFQVGCDVAPAATLAPDTPCDEPVSHNWAQTHHIHGSPVYWRSATRGPVIYVWAEDDILRAFPFDEKQGKFVNVGADAAGPRVPISIGGCGDPNNKMAPWTTGQAKSPGYFAPDQPNGFAQLHQGMTGGMLSLSSNQGRGGIVWATTPTNNDANQKVVPGILRAYDADDLKRELWNSYRNRARDDFGNFSKHAPPTVANGKVYVATFSNHLSVYGLNPPSPTQPAPNLLKNGGFEEGAQGWTGNAVFQVNSAYPYYENQQGALCPTAQTDATLSQTVVAPETASYTLTAWCATNILPGNITAPARPVTLGVTVNGQPIAAPPARVVAYNGYQKYTLSFRAPAGGSIRVWYYAPKVRFIPNFGAQQQPASYAVIDAVSLVKTGGSTSRPNR